MINESEWDKILDPLVSDENDTPTYLMKIIGKDVETYCDYERITLFLERTHPNNKDLVKEFLLKLVKDFDLDIDFSKKDCADSNAYIDNFIIQNTSNIKENLVIKSALYYDDTVSGYKSRLIGNVGVPNKLTPPITLTTASERIDYGNKLTLIANISNQLVNGFIYFYDGQTLLGSQKINNDGQAIFSFYTNGMIGLHSYYALFKGNEYYLRRQTTDPLNVIIDRISPNINLWKEELNDTYTHIGVELSFQDMALTDNKGTVEFFADGVSLGTTTIQAQDTISYGSVDVLNHQVSSKVITAKFSGNDYFKPTQKEMSISIPTTVVIETDKNSLYTGESAIIKATVKDSQGIVIPNMDVSFDNNVNEHINTTQTDIAGVAFCNFVFLNNNTAHIKARVISNSDYNTSISNELTIELDGKIATVLNGSFTSNYKITGMLNDAYGAHIANEALSLTLSNTSVTKDYTATTDSNGEINIDFDLAPGTYHGKITFLGDSKYGSSNYEFDFTAKDKNKTNTILTATAYHNHYGATENNYLIGKLTDDSNFPVNDADINILLVNTANNTNNLYTVATEEYGYYKLPMAKIESGDYIAKISYSGDRKYNDADEISTVVTITKYNTRVTMQDYDSVNRIIKGQLINVDNNTIIPRQEVLLHCVKLSNTNVIHDYNINTLDDGTYELETSSWAAGRYTVTVSYAGNDDYYASNAVSNEITKE